MATAAVAPAFEAIPPSRRMIAGLSLAAANLMVVLDLTIANVSVPHIAGDLGISLDQGAWIITSYAVAEAICVPLSGWLADRFGAVRVFVSALFGFGLFSLLCGLSPTLGTLVAFRIGQGLCGAPLMPISQALMLRVFPPEKRAGAIATWAMTVMVGPALGPILGGLISDTWSWHWIFLINVPLAMLCTVAAWILLRPVETEIRKTPIDKMGLGLLVFWIGCLQIMLDIGRDHDWFGDPLIVGLAICAAVGFVAFVIWELTEEHPVVDLRIFRSRGFTAGVFSLTFSFGAYFAGVVIIPQWLQSSMGYTATLAGLATSFTAMIMIVMSQVVARVMDKFDPRVLVSFGMIWTAGATLLRVNWNTQIDFWGLAFPQIMLGFGMAFFIVPLTSITLSVVRPDQIAAAAGLQNFLRTMGIALATSLSLTMVGNTERAAQTEIASQLQPAETLSTLQSMGMGLEQSREFIMGLASQQALMIAVNYLFWISAALTLAAAALIWVSPRPPKGPPATNAH